LSKFYRRVSACSVDTITVTISQPFSGTSRSTRSTVKRTLSVEDLDISRSTSAENLSDGKLNGKFIVVNSKRRRKQKQQQSKCLQNQLQQSQQSQTVNDEDQMGVQTSESQSLTEPVKTIADLTDEIKTLKATVETLQNQLEFVLSFLGITNIANSSGQSTSVEQSARQTSHVAATPSHTDGLVSRDPSILSSSDATSLPTNCSDAFVKNDQPQSYENIVSKPSALSVPFRHAVVSAVYADFEEKDRHAKNLVISGLPLSSTSDKVALHATLLN